MSKVDRILDQFPWFYRARERGKLLYQVMQALATPVDEADTSLLRIQRAHRLKLAESVEDVLRLAAALNLGPVHFQDLTDNHDLPYEERLTRMRERIVRLARVHLAGLGTPWAIMESTAIFLDATLVAEQPNGPVIRPLDSQGYSYIANLEYARPAGAPRGRLLLHEGPLVRRKLEPTPRRPMDQWTLQNRGADAAPVILAITGVEDRTVRPSVFSPTSGAGIVFNGIVPDGKTLRIDAGAGARIDDVPVDAWITYYEGGQHDFATYDQAQMCAEQSTPVNPFDGDLTTANVLAQRRPTPDLPPGASTWYFTVEQGVFDSSLCDFAVYEVPTGPIGVYDSDLTFDSSCFDYPSSGIVAAAWDERQLCAFKLLLPGQPISGAAAAGASTAPAQPVAPTSGSDLVARIAGTLPRFKAAGVRAYVDTARPSWIVGEGVLRNSRAADGPGIAADATILRSPNTDLYVESDAPA